MVGGAMFCCLFVVWGSTFLQCSGLTDQPTTSDGIDSKPPCVFPEENFADVFRVHMRKYLYEEGETMRLSCQDNSFVFSGSQEWTCRNNGSWWFSSMPVCKDPACRDPDFPERGYVTLAMQGPNAVAKFSCEAGFTVQPSAAANVTCLNHGWERPFPICEVYCEPLNNVLYGNWTTECTHAECVAVLTCEEDLIPHPVDKLMCQGAKGWEPGNLIMACVGDGLKKISTDLVPEVFQTSATEAVSEAMVDERSANASGLEDTEINGNSSEVEDVSEQPVEISCPNPHRFPNGKFSVHMGRINYRCQFTYLLVGQPNRVCEKSGNWSGYAPKCLHISDPDGDFKPDQLIQYWQEIFRIFRQWAGSYVIVNKTVEASLKVKQHEPNTVDFMFNDDKAEVKLQAVRKMDHMVFKVFHVDVASDVFVAHSNWSFRAIIRKDRRNWTLTADWFSEAIPGFKSLVLHPAPRTGGIVRANKEKLHQVQEASRAGLAKAVTLGIFFGGLAVIVAAGGAFLVVRRYRTSGGLSGVGTRVAGFENPVYNQQMTS